MKVCYVTQVLKQGTSINMTVCDLPKIKLSKYFISMIVYNELAL